MAEKAGRAAGYILAYTAAGEAEIARIAVAKELQRQGVARALLEAACVALQDTGDREAFAGTCDQETRRRGRSMRRAVSGRTASAQRFYQDPEEDAVLMSKEI